MLGPEQGYDGMYGQGPPSVHSSHGGRAYQPQGKFYVSFVMKKKNEIKTITFNS